MKIEEIVQRAIVIDNRQEEADGLVKALEENDIAVDELIIKEDEEITQKFTHNRELIFADLLLDEKPEHLISNISRLINILNQIQCSTFGPYGLVLWTKHDDDNTEFLRRLNRSIYEKPNENDNTEEEEISTDIHLNNAPIFVVCLPKGKYMKGDDHFDFSNVLQDLDGILQNNNAAYFSLTWFKSISDSASKVLSNMYQVAHDIEKQESKITYLLMKLAQNETASADKGHILTIGAYKAFDSLLNSELAGLVRNESIPNFSNFDETPFGSETEELQKISATLNEKMFIDDQAINNNEILPGNVYEIIDKDSPLKISKEERTKLCIKVNDGEFVNTKDYNCKHIAVELTPPCDAANKKIYSRMVGGYIVKMALGKNEKGKIRFKCQSSEKTYAIYPIRLPKLDDVYVIIFDFRHLWTPRDEDIKNSTKFKLLFKFTPPLFADILQKFSSHASRLGLGSFNLAEG